MAELKTRPERASITDFINGIDDAQKRVDVNYGTK